MIKSKKQMYIVVGVFALVLMLGTVTYAFFNYTRTGSANTIRTGRISFNTSQSNTLNLTNVFPMSSTDAGNANLNAVSVRIWGDTTYTGGEEFEISIVDVNNTIGSGQSTKTVPINYIASYSATPVQEGDPNVIGTNSDSYFTARGQSSPVYQLSATGEATNGEQVLIGYIPSGATGVDGTLTIKAYLDSSKVAISDTYPAEETDTNSDGYIDGTPANFGEGRVVLTTTEWNALQNTQTPLSFKIKAVSQEGTWVEEPPIKLYEKIRLSLTEYNSDTDSNNVTYISGCRVDAGCSSETTIDFNYVWYSGKLWRVVAIYPNGEMKLITENPITSMLRSNSTNEYGPSWTRQWLNEDFKDTLVNQNDVLIFDNDDFYWNGIITSLTTMPTKETERAFTDTVGLLDAYEYAESYKKATDSSKGYLNIKQNWQLITPSNNSLSDSVRYVSYDGTLSSTSYSSDNSIRPAIYLKSTVSVLDGDGTRNNPYRINEDIQTALVGTNLNTRVSGEYVTFKNILFRIVGVENGTTKIITADYFENDNNIIIKKFSNSPFYGKYMMYPKSPEYFDYYFNNVWLTDDDKNYLEQGAYYLGKVDTSSSSGYKNTICKSNNTTETVKDCVKLDNSNDIFVGYVGLNRYGEMFSAQIKERNSSNSRCVFLITPTGSDKVYVNSTTGSMDQYTYSSSCASRPTFHLKSNIIISSGNGTEHNPFQIELGL